MANDGGQIAKLEQWMADQLAALQSGGENVFATADVYRYQLDAVKGGLEKFDQYQPFAFVKYVAADGVREGGNALRRVMEFAVVIGKKSKTDGVARFGSDTEPGISKIADLVIALFDHAHPGDGYDCDDFYYTTDAVSVEDEKRFALELRFETSRMEN